MPAPTTPPLLWKPGRDLLERSLLRQYMDWLFVKKGLYIRHYDDLWSWSVTDLEDFWESIYQFFNVQSHSDYQQVIIKPDRGMIGTRWFDGATVNYAEHIFRHQTPERPALLIASEKQPVPQEISWAQLTRQVAAVVAFLHQSGVGVGDRVVAVLPNGLEAVVAFLATNAVGAIWSSCSADFGTTSIVDRFQQIEPKMLIATDGYTYNGKPIDKTDAMRELRLSLPTLQRVIWVPYLSESSRLERAVLWNDVLKTPAHPLTFEPVPFEHPIWIVYSSGTTGKPKAITHSVGGCLLEHLKAVALHQDVRPGERYFWYSTTGWMMWNFALGAMLAGATLVLYEGSPAYPSLNVLWNLIDLARINHFGVGAAYLVACMRQQLEPLKTHRLTTLRTIASTGSPLPAECFQWVYKSVKPSSWLISFSGGTDVCSGFVGGNPLLPVYEGEIQCRLLGCKVEAFDEDGRPVYDSVGEMMLLEPMPSMPLYFWSDPGGQRYENSYFADNSPYWRHGDWIEITNRRTVLIYGRSDATLNRDGIRMGTSEIYGAVESVLEVADSVIVGLEQPGGSYFLPLFVVLREGPDGKPQVLTDELCNRIKQQLRKQYSPRHVPDVIVQIPEVPYTLNGKKLETPIKKILSGMDVSLAVSLDTLRNPSALDVFQRLSASGFGQLDFS